MICKNCGNEIRDDARFCPHCGQMSDPDLGSGLPQGAAPYSAPAYTGPEAPVTGGGKKKGLIIGGVIVAVAVIAILVVVASGMFSSAKGQVEKAAIKSVAAYAAAEGKLGMPDVSQWQQEQNIFQRMTLELTGINSDLIGYDLSSLEGLGLQMSTNYDGSGRELSFDMNAYWENTNLLSFQMAADDDEMYFCLPQFTGDTYYGVNTETLGADLTAMTGDDSAEGMSFNLFDLVELVLERVDQEAMEQSLKEASKTLWEAAKVKKTGAMTLDLNGANTKTTAYHVTFPEAALNQYVDDLETVLSAMNYYDLYEELYHAMGMPQDEIDEIMSMLEEFDAYGELADSLRDAVAEMGDLELDVCLSNGYLSAVLYEGEIDGVDVELALYLGGNGEYVDDVSMDLEVDDIRITLKSSGDHSLKSGVYTDDTTVQVRQQNTSVAKITSELSYDPKASGSNFQWELGANSSGLSLFTLETEGNLSMDKDAFAMELDDVSLRIMGMKMCNLSFEYGVSNQPRPLDLEGARLITDMDLNELMALAGEIEDNAGVWLEDVQALFLARLPQELLWDMMY